MIKAIAVDDEPLALELIEAFSQQFDFLQFEKGFTKTAAACSICRRTRLTCYFSI